MFDGLAADLMEDLFGEFGQAATLHRAAGGRDSIRVVVRSPMVPQGFASVGVRTAPNELDILMVGKDAAPPEREDSVALKNGESFTLRGEPTLDDLGLVWTAGASRP